MNMVLNIKNDMAELDELHRFVEEVGRTLGLSKKCIFEINIALEEVFSNSVAYAYEDDRDHEIKITVIPPVNGSLVLRIEDNGKSYNPIKVAEPELKYDLEKCGIGGLGLHLVKNLMDDIRWLQFLVVGLHAVLLVALFAPLKPPQGRRDTLDQLEEMAQQKQLEKMTYIALSIDPGEFCLYPAPWSPGGLQGEYDASTLI